jgi:hypothetical protein
LDACVVDAQSDRVIVMRGGTPVALVVGVQGLDEEQIQLGASDEFWKLISTRRKEPTLGRSALEKKLKDKQQRTLWPDKSIEEISQAAMNRHRKNQ